MSSVTFAALHSTASSLCNWRANPASESQVSVLCSKLQRVLIDQFAEPHRKALPTRRVFECWNLDENLSGDLTAMVLEPKNCTNNLHHVVLRFQSGLCWGWLRSSVRYSFIFVDAHDWRLLVLWAPKYVEIARTYDSDVLDRISLPNKAWQWHVKTLANI